jgi:hypothetical protein
MFVGVWSFKLLGYVRSGDIRAIPVLPEVEGLEESLKRTGYDRIITYSRCRPKYTRNPWAKD